MEHAETANQAMKKSFSLQAEIIRQIQANDGKTPCYATATVNYCDKKECGWRHDCFEETHPHQ